MRPRRRLWRSAAFPISRTIVHPPDDPSGRSNFMRGRAWILAANRAAYRVHPRITLMARTLGAREPRVLANRVCPWAAVARVNGAVGDCFNVATHHPGDPRGQLVREIRHPVEVRPWFAAVLVFNLAHDDWATVLCEVGLNLTPVVVAPLSHCIDPRLVVLAGFHTGDCLQPVRETTSRPFSADIL